MDCCACKASMAEVVVDGVTIDRCGRCGGVWLDAGEAEELAQKSKPTKKDELRQKKYELLRQWKTGPQTSKPGDRECPRCHARLSRANYKDVPGLHVDLCATKSCGLYLDKGELEKIRLIG